MRKAAVLAPTTAANLIVRDDGARWCPTCCYEDAATRIAAPRGSR